MEETEAFGVEMSLCVCAVDQLKIGKVKTLAKIQWHNVRRVVAFSAK